MALEFKKNELQYLKDCVYSSVILGHNRQLGNSILKKIEHNLHISPDLKQKDQCFCSCDNPNGFAEMEQGKETCSQCEKPY